MNALVTRAPKDPNAPGFDQMCAIAYMFAKSRIADVPLFDRRVQDAYEASVRLKPVPGKRGRFMGAIEHTLGNLDYGYKDVDYIDYSAAFEHVINKVDLSSIFERIVLETNKVNKIRYGSNILSHPENTGAAFQAIKIAITLSSGINNEDEVEREARSSFGHINFEAIKKEDFSGAEVSQLIQCWVTGMCENIREQIDIVDATLHAKSQNKRIFAKLGGKGRQDLSRSESSTGEVSRSISNVAGFIGAGDGNTVNRS